MGGPQSANDDNPGLIAEMKLMEEALAGGVAADEVVRIFTDEYTSSVERTFGTLARIHCREEQSFAIRREDMFSDAFTLHLRVQRYERKVVHLRRVDE